MVFEVFFSRLWIPAYAGMAILWLMRLLRLSDFVVNGLAMTDGLSSGDGRFFRAMALLFFGQPSYQCGNQGR
jgi:hypothetical protein